MNPTYKVGSAEESSSDQRTTNPRIGDPSVCLHEGGWSEVLILVPPVRGARGGTAGTENAFIHAIELLTVLLRLNVFALLRGVVVLQIGLNRLVLLVEESEIGNQVLDNVHWTRKVRGMDLEVAKTTNCVEVGKSWCPSGFGQFGRGTQEYSVRLCSWRTIHKYPLCKTF